MNAKLIFEYLTQPMAWVTASFGGIFFSSLFGYKTGDISAAHTLTLIIFSVLGYAAAHFTQYRIGRSLEMTQD